MAGQPRVRHRKTASHRAARVVLAAMTLLSIIERSVAGQTPEPRRPLVRELYVPFDQLPVLLESAPERVFMPREQYEELLGLAAAHPAEPAPLAAAVVDAAYSAELFEGRARINGTVRIEVLHPGLHAVGLPMSGVGLLRATLDDQPASIGRDADGQATLFVNGLGRHTLRLEFTAPVQTTAAQQSLQAHLPAAPVSSLELVVPGNVELKSGADVVARIVDEGAGNTQFRLLAPSGPWNFVLSLNNRVLRRDRVMVARSVVLDEVSQAVERFHVTSTVSVLHGAVEQIEYHLPESFEITDVACDQLSRWELASPADGKRRLRVHLRAPSAEPMTIRLAGERVASSGADWRFPTIEVLDTAGSVAVLGLLVEDLLRVHDPVASGLVSIDRAILSHAGTDAMPAETGIARSRPVLAYYAPQGSYSLTARFERPPATLDVVTSLLLRVDNKGVETAGIFSLRPKVERVFSFAFLAPPGWNVRGVTDAQGNQLAFESFPIEDGATRVQVRLPQGVSPGETRTVLFTAVGDVAGWVGEWAQKELAFPVFRLEQSDNDTGALAVLAYDDLAIRPQSLEQLSPLNSDERQLYGLQQDADLAFRYDAPPYAATFLAERKAPSVTATTFAFLTVAREGMKAHYEVAFSVREATTRRLRVSLPESTPSEVSITGLDGTTVRESTASIVDGRRVWDVLLSDNVPLNENRIGAARIAMDLQMELAAEPNALALPLPRAESVAYQSGFVAVEGDAEREIAVRTEARRVDVGELSESRYQPGKRLLGSYGFIGEPPAITVDAVRRDAHGLPAAIAQRCALRTVFSATGVSQTVARFELRTKALLLEARLPDPSAELWSVVVDDVPVTPQRDGDTLLVSLPAATDRDLRVLEIAYELPVSAIGLWGQVDTAAPRLLLPGSTASPGAANADVGAAPPASRTDSLAIPVADLEWNVLLPPGYEVTHSGGTLHWTPPAKRPWWKHVVDGAIGAGTALASPIAMRFERVLPQANFAAPASEWASVDRAAAPPSGGELMPMMDDSMPKSEPEQPMRAANEPPPAEAEGAEVTKGVIATGRDGAVRRESLQLGQTAAPTSGGLDKKDAAWDLAGVRSLRVNFENAFANADPGRLVRLRSLGEGAVLSIRVVNRFRLVFAASAIGLAVFAVGLRLVRRPWNIRLRYLIAVGALAVAIPAAVGWERELHEISGSAIAAVIFLVPLYVVVGIVRGLLGAANRATNLAGRAAGIASVVLVSLAIGVGTAPVARAQAPSGQVPVEFEEWLKRFPMWTPPRVVIPEDAIVIPYAPAAERDPRDGTDRVFVPHAKYVELWNRAHPEQPLDATRPPVDFAIGPATFSATLNADDFLELVGQMDIEVFVDRPVAVPLPFGGGVLVRGSLDGAAARIVVGQSQLSPAQPSPPAQAQQAQAEPPAEPPAVLVLHVEGKGRKRLEIRFRMRVDRRGGWRMVRGVLPAPPASALTLTVPETNTEVRLGGVADRSNYETTQAGERIETSLLAQNEWTLQWRPKVGEGQIDRTLTAESDAVLDIQEDGVRLAWRSTLQFRGGRREDFTFRLPDGYLVERVSGPNIRGWTAEPDAQGVRLDVELLRAAVDQETVTIYLSKRAAIAGAEPSRLEAPGVVVADAALHHGLVTVRRSPLVDLRATRLEGASRSDVPAEQAEALMSEAGAEERPIPVQPFQAFRFSTFPFALEFEARTIRPSVAAETRSIVRVGERETRLECQFELRIGDAPLHAVRIGVPPSFELEQISQPEWVVTDADGARTVTIYLDAGHVGSLSFSMLGSLGKRTSADPVELPRLRVFGADRQTGQFAIQIDPAFRVRAEELANCEMIPPERVMPWLREDQRPLLIGGAALAVDGDAYSARLVIARRPPVVRCVTLSNVNITPRSIEETTLLEFRVLESGIQRIEFQLPARMAEARIKVPALRQKTVVPVEGGDPAKPMVRVRIDLQDELMDIIRVVVEHDGLLTAAEHEAAIPIVETGSVEQQYVTLQNSGRDEVVTLDATGFDELTRLQTAWKALADLDIEQGYAMRRDAPAARLAVQTKPRQVMRTVDARIGFAETILVVDANGDYRARHQLRIENNTEQYLEVELPDGATLWTARVAGEPAKPTRSPDSKSANRMRIPLVKTEAGDTDYPVELVYAGRVDRLSGWSTVRFPLIRTVNIHTELSQVTLHLPESHRWVDFQGASRLRDQSEYAAGYTNYFNEKVAKVSRAFESGSDYDKARARRSIEKLEQEYQSAGQTEGRGTTSLGLITQQADPYQATQAIERAKQIVMDDGTSRTFTDDNRTRLNTFFLDQSNSRARNLVITAQGNFSYQPPAKADAGRDAKADAPFKGRFNDAWFSKNNLGYGTPLGSEGKAQPADQLAKMPQSKTANVDEAEQKKAVEELRTLNRDVQSRFRRQAQREFAPQTADPSATPGGTAGVSGFTSNAPGGPAAPATRESAGRDLNALDDSGGLLAGGGARMPRRGDAAAPPSSMMGGRGQIRGGQMGGGGMGMMPGMAGGFGGAMPQSPQSFDDFAAQNAGPPPAVEGMASLDLTLPTRGQVFYFRASRGEVSITGRAIESDWIGRAVRTAVGLAIGGVFWIALKPRSRRARRAA
ncbi:MAG: hypothetical protein FJ297_14990 [Planctomycetes bacterium]|nr:hypothetical protein [Planctomycetota bacterium]